MEFECTHLMLIYQLRRFENIYEATSENQNLKIQISAAESTAENVIAENEELRKLLKVNYLPQSNSIISRFW